MRAVIDTNVLIRALMDSVEIEPAPRGTRVTMHRRLTGAPEPSETPSEG